MFREELSIKRYNTMKPYEYMKYSYQIQLVGTFNLDFTSNKENAWCIVASVPHISLMYLLPGSFVSVQEVTGGFLHKTLWMFDCSQQLLEIWKI